jgi:hypothetical protein
VYVGEAGDVNRRLASYVKPGGDARKRHVNRWLADELAAHGVEVQLHTLIHSAWRQQTYQNEWLDLRHRPTRLLLENALLVEYYRQEVIVENF